MGGVDGKYVHPCVCDQPTSRLVALVLYLVWYGVGYQFDWLVGCAYVYTCWPGGLLGGLFLVHPVCVNRSTTSTAHPKCWVVRDVRVCTVLLVTVVSMSSLYMYVCY